LIRLEFSHAVLISYICVVAGSCSFAVTCACQSSSANHDFCFRWMCWILIV